MTKKSLLFLCLISLWAFLPQQVVEAQSGGGVFVRRSADYPVSSGSWITVPWDQCVYDPDNYFTGGSTTLVVPAGHAGWHIACFQVRWDSVGGDTRYIRLYTNDSPSLYQCTRDAEAYQFQAQCINVWLEVGETIYIKAYQDTGSTRDLLAGYTQLRVTELMSEVSGEHTICGKDITCYPLSDDDMLYFDEVSDTWKNGYIPMDALPAHHETHENGGSDEINVGGLSGTLADYQKAGWIRDILIASNPPGPYNVLYYQIGLPSVWRPGTLPAAGLPVHAWTHQDGGVDEINVFGLSGLLGDVQDAGWLQGLSISTVAPEDDQVLTYDIVADEWQPDTVAGGFTMPEVITVVITNIVPVRITDTYHYTLTLSSGNDIAVIRSFTFGEATVAIGLFIVATLLCINLLFERLK